MLRLKLRSKRFPLIVMALVLPLLAITNAEAKVDCRTSGGFSIKSATPDCTPKLCMKPERARECRDSCPPIGGKRPCEDEANLADLDASNIKATTKTPPAKLMDIRKAALGALASIDAQYTSKTELRNALKQLHSTIEKGGDLSEPIKNTKKVCMAECKNCKDYKCLYVACDFWCAPSTLKGGVFSKGCKREGVVAWPDATYQIEILPVKGKKKSSRRDESASDEEARPKLERSKSERRVSKRSSDDESDSPKSKTKPKRRQSV